MKPNAKSLIDAQGNETPLGKLIGKGGEGEVFAVLDDRQLVAKIYRKLPLEPRHAEKLGAMTKRWTDDLEKIAAWPRQLLFEARNKRPCGVLMSRIDKARPLHELYGTTNRRRYFPDVAWHHLLLAARNTAAAFGTLHDAGIVVGDVNQGNLMVDQRMCVRLIDCDSFQLTEGDKRFACPVGTPHFTPPELQSKLLRDVERTADHDGFGLAVLIFHLLFVGRHPFAGRFRGSGDMPIEKAIAERRFAFSRDKAATQIDPPTASLLLEDLPPPLATLFETAFRAECAPSAKRPTPVEWAEQLELLMKQRKVCSYDPVHVHYQELSECPWCRIEEEGGPAFFVPSGGASSIAKSRLKDLDARVRALRAIDFVDLAPGRLAMPQAAKIKQATVRPKPTRRDGAAVGLVLSALLCLASPASLTAYGVGLVGMMSSASYLAWSAAGKTLRLDLAKLKQKADEHLAKTAQAAQTIWKRHRRRSRTFQSAFDELKEETANYLAEGESLKRAIVKTSDAHKNEFLRSHMIRDYIAEIPGLTVSHVGMFESFGVETAADVDRIKLYGVPGVDAELELELNRWFQQLERSFVFRPDHGVTAQVLEAAGEVAVQRFKMSQARKVLTGAKQLQGLTSAGRSALDGELAAFDALVDRWRSVAKQMRDLQTNRRPLERFLNRSPASLAAIVLGVGLLGLLLAWLS